MNIKGSWWGGCDDGWESTGVGGYRGKAVCSGAACRETFPRCGFSGCCLAQPGKQEPVASAGHDSAPTEEEIRKGFAPRWGSGAVVWDSGASLGSTGHFWGPGGWTDGAPTCLGLPAPVGRDSPGQGFPRDLSRSCGLGLGAAWSQAETTLVTRDSRLLAGAPVDKEGFLLKNRGRRRGRRARGWGHYAPCPPCTLLLSVTAVPPAVIRAKAVSEKEVDSGNDIYGNPIKRIQYEIKQIKVTVATGVLGCTVGTAVGCWGWQRAGSLEHDMATCGAGQRSCCGFRRLGVRERYSSPQTAVYGPRLRQERCSVVIDESCGSTKAPLQRFRNDLIGAEDKGTEVSSEDAMLQLTALCPPAMFKGPEKDIEFIYTAPSSAVCGVSLDVGGKKEYLIAGVYEWGHQPEACSEARLFLDAVQGSFPRLRGRGGGEAEEQ
ncbi:hypothetical protein P7K49_011949 [Saguinus oedipus]|uniref:NTR domain-containing protein n=1 Tax=Saguinus oedipus TaxID=9490 RepID=A0ABQ9VS41_SAGOE|nr:hypothetical protein P7K49_011949 [Saguinus oedipus]